MYLLCSGDIKIQQLQSGIKLGTAITLLDLRPSCIMFDKTNSRSLVYLLARLLEKHPSVLRLALNYALTSNWASRTSIEILPDHFESAPGQQSSDDMNNASFPFLFIDNNLGVPKKILYSTYISALAVFSDAKNASNRDNSMGLTTIQSLTSSTAAILLANPSHMTALNSRKRLIQKTLLDPHQELHFVASLLSSRNC